MVTMTMLGVPFAFYSECLHLFSLVLFIAILYFAADLGCEGFKFRPNLFLLPSHFLVFKFSFYEFTLRSAEGHKAIFSDSIQCIDPCRTFPPVFLTSPLMLVPFVS